MHKKEKEKYSTIINGNFMLINLCFVNKIARYNHNGHNVVEYTY